MLHLAIQRVTDALADYVSARTGDREAGAQAMSQSRLATHDTLAVTLARLDTDRPLQTPPLRAESGAYARTLPPTVFSAHLLVAATHADYADALEAVGHAVAFVGSGHANAALSAAPDDTRVTVELASLTFEEQRHLWAALGVPYLPSVVYRMRALAPAEDGARPVPPVESPAARP